MSFLDELKEQRTTPASAFHKYMLNLRNREVQVHAFFEGQDDRSFFGPHIRTYTSDFPHCTYHPYVCGGKQQVFSTKEKIYSGTTPAANLVLLFFVDKDLSDFIKENHPTFPDLFTTKFYSIENYLVSEEMLLEVWQDILHVEGISPKFERISQRFGTERDKFYRFVAPISAWIVYLRRKGVHPNVDDIRMQQLCEIDSTLTFQSFHDSYEAERIFMKVCPMATEADWLACSEVLSEFVGVDPKTYVRGKFELWFFLEFIKKLVTGLSKPAENGHSSSIVQKIKLSESNALVVLGPRLPIPEEVKQVLDDQLMNRLAMFALPEADFKKVD